MMKLKLSKGQEQVYNLIKRKGEIEQREINEYLLKENNLKDMLNARVTTSRILSALRSENLVKKRQEKNEGPGGIYKNIWSLIE